MKTTAKSRKAEEKTMERRLLFVLLVWSGAALSSHERVISPVQQLRCMLDSGKLEVMPCCYDGLTARLVENAGFKVTFMTGYGVSASRGFPDVQLVSFGEMVDSATVIASATRLPFIADGDTGGGNAMNVKRTVKGFAQVGAAGVMIEDQQQPKRCGHVGGKTVVGREEAVLRIRAACDARDELKEQGLGDVVIVARTDANALDGFEEAVLRCQLFREAGADITFMEAPKSIDEMRRYCEQVDGPKLANMLEGGKTPLLPPDQLQALGFSLAAYPTTLLSASAMAMKNALRHLKEEGKTPDDLLLSFPDLCTTVGFDDYFQDARQYTIDDENTTSKKKEAPPS